jgi:hypothetical protein
MYGYNQSAGYTSGFDTFSIECFVLLAAVWAFASISWRILTLSRSMAAGTSYFCPIGQLLQGRLGFNC